MRIIAVIAVACLSISACTKRAEPVPTPRPMDSGPNPPMARAPVSTDPLAAIPAAPEQCAGVRCGVLALPFVDSDPARSATLFKKGCETGDGIACAALAKAFKRGVGVEADSNAALTLYRKSCDLDYFKGCHNLGLILFNGEGVPADEAGGLRALAKACDGGAWRACGSLGDYYRGRGEVERAGAFLKRGCDNADRLSCEMLAKLAPRR